MHRKCCYQIDYELLLLLFGDGLKCWHMTEKGLDICCCSRAAARFSVHACQLATQIFTSNESFVIHVVTDVLSSILTATYSVTFLLKCFTCFGKFERRASYICLSLTPFYCFILWLMTLIIWDSEIFYVSSLYLKTKFISTRSNPEVDDYVPVRLRVILFYKLINPRKRFITIGH